MIPLYTAISLSALLFLLFFLYNDVRVDRVRQRLFDIRNALFDEAAAGNISFDSATYRATRSTLNGMIRFAHRLSLSRFIAFQWMLTPTHRAFAQTSFEARMGDAGGEDRKLCDRYLREAHLAVAKHLMSSPLLIPLLVAVVTLLVAQRGVSMAAASVAHWKRQFDALDRLAYQQGQTTDQVLC